MPNTCAVTGNVKNLLGQNVQNCTVKASVLTPFFHTGDWISGEVASTTTNASGNFSLSVVETETVGTKITFTLEYNDGTAGIKRRAYTVVVPDDATASLADLVSAPVTPITYETLAAQYVTVSAVSGLSATQAQAAFAEHQSDITALQTDLDADEAALAAHLADTTDAHDASAISVTPSGNLAADDVQEALTELQTDIDTRATSAALTTHAALTATHGVSGAIVGTTDSQTLTNKTIVAGSNTITGIANTNVDAAAAIAYSKLNLATSIVNADVSASAAIAYTKLGPTYPTVQRFTSGSGTYTTPANVRWIKVKMVGGGGGGGGSGTASNGTGGTGGSTTFGSSLLTATGGTGGAALTGGSGGSATVNSPAIAVASLSGTRGGSGMQTSVTTVYAIGGAGSGSPFASGGPAGAPIEAGYTPAANSGAGGGGGSGPSSGSTVNSGGGGAAGAYIEAIITAPSATYAYAVGAAGTAGTAGTSGYAGGAGAAGVIIVEEYYI